MSSKRNLTSREISGHLGRAKAMRTAGVEIEIPTEWPDTEPLEIQTGGRETTLVFDTPGGGAAYAIWLRLIARASITLLDCEVISKFDDQIALASFPLDEKICRHVRLEYPKDQVLNTRLENSLSLRRGQVLEGRILAWGMRPIPGDYWHGFTFPGSLVFLDQYQNEISRELEIFADRTWQSKKVKEPSVGLCGGPEPPESLFNKMLREYGEIRQQMELEPKTWKFPGIPVDDAMYRKLMGDDE